MNILSVIFPILLKVLIYDISCNTNILLELLGGEML